MSTEQQRTLSDQASRDEARMRRSQQATAGTTHSPMQDMPQHGEDSSDPKSPQALANLEREYVRCLDHERQAWSALGGLPGEAGFDDGAWNRWRSAVEDRDRATRLLINYALTEGAD